MAQRFVRMFARENCHLCEVARAIIETERTRTSFEFDEVVIDGDDALERAYGVRVPVVEIDGREEFEAHVDAVRFAALVRRR